MTGTVFRHGRLHCGIARSRYTDLMSAALNNVLHILLITIIPGVEVRGALPYAIGVLKMPPWEALLTATLANLCIIPLFYAVERPLLALLSRWGWFRRYRERLVHRSETTLTKYGLFIGLAVFVAIPLPGTGAYSGCILAELAGMKKPAAIAAISIGVVVACLLVFLVSVGVIKGVLARWL